MEDKQKQNQKSENKFVSVMKAIFVHNIGWKLLALFSAAVIWALSVGFGIM